MKDSLDDELKNISPWLHDMKQPDDGFRVPDGYFGTLEARVFARLEAEGLRQAPKNMYAKHGGQWYRRPRMMWAAAASVCAVFAAIWLLRPQPVAVVASVDLSAEELEEYVLDNVHEFDLEQLASIPKEDVAEAVEPNTQPSDSQKKNSTIGDEFAPEDVEKLLNDMSEEELESIL